MNQVKHIGIVGGGIGGLTVAVLLEQSGFSVTVFEQASEIKPMGTGLSIMANAMLALKRLGREDLVVPVGQPIVRCEMRKIKTGRKICAFPIDSLSRSLGVQSYCLHRGAFLLHLRKHISDGAVLLGKRVKRVEQSTRGATVLTESNDRFEFDVVIGADGFHSASRSSLQLNSPPRPTKFLAWLAISKSKPEGFLPGDTIHYWGKGIRVGLVDIGFDQLYWWVTMNDRLLKKYGVSLGDNTRVGKKTVLDILKGSDSAVLHAIENTDEEGFIQIKTRDRVPISSFVDEHVALIGDAAHPMLTSMGQGACVAIEDAVVLTECLRDYREDGAFALRRYNLLRMKRANYFVKMSRQIAWHEQFQNPIACFLRDHFFALCPESFFKKQLSPLFSFERQDS